MGKLPYIPDKKMYAAVMGACSYIRETGYFNKATQYYADKYHVDVEQVRKYVRIAQGNGQKQAAKKAPRKYKWYAVAVMEDYYYLDYDVGRYFSFEWSEKEKDENTHICIVKATSVKNAKSKIEDFPNRPVWWLLSVPHKENLVREIIECETEKEAKEKQNALKIKYNSCL